VIGLVDTNCDPDEASYIIPGNDDAMRSCSLITRVIADGVEAGKQKVTAEELSRKQAQKPEPAAAPESAPEPEPAAAPEPTAKAEPEAAPAAEPEPTPEAEEVRS
jgi:small subunit ribosomal protein S2